MTFIASRDNPRVRIYVRKADEALAEIGYTEHGERHVENPNGQSTPIHPARGARTENCEGPAREIGKKQHCPPPRVPGGAADSPGRGGGGDASSAGAAEAGAAARGRRAGDGHLSRVDRNGRRHRHVGGRGGAFMQVEMKDIEAGTKTNQRFRTEDKVERAFVDPREMTFSYQDGDNYVFMDKENYEEFQPVLLI